MFMRILAWYFLFWYLCLIWHQDNADLLSLMWVFHFNYLEEFVDYCCHFFLECLVELPMKPSGPKVFLGRKVFSRKIGNYIFNFLSRRRAILVIYFLLSKLYGMSFKESVHFMDLVEFIGNKCLKYFLFFWLAVQLHIWTLHACSVKIFYF